MRFESHAYKILWLNKKIKHTENLNVCEINKYVINQIKQDLERVPNTEQAGYSEEPLRQRNTYDKIIIMSHIYIIIKNKIHHIIY
jgi:hypothetical protein